MDSSDGIVGQRPAGDVEGMAADELCRGGEERGKESERVRERRGGEEWMGGRRWLGVGGDLLCVGRQWLSLS